jgi:hypothetical protein
MPGAPRPASASPDQATLTRLADRYRTRLRWPHVLVVAVAALLLLVGLGGLGSVWLAGRNSQRIGTAATRGSWTVLFGALYVAGAAMLTYGLARFDTRRALRRFPLTLVFGLAVLAGAAVVGLLHNLLPGSGSSGGGDGGGSERTGPQSTDKIDANVETLACALVDSDLAARVLGGPLSEVTKVPSLSRNRSICLCKTADSGSQLLVSVCEGKRAAARFGRIARRGTEMAGIGDRALRLSDAVAGRRTAIAVRQGPWLVDLTVRTPDEGRVVDEAALIQLARTAVKRLARDARVT